MVDLLPERNLGGGIERGPELLYGIAFEDLRNLGKRGPGASGFPGYQIAPQTVPVICAHVAPVRDPTPGGHGAV